MALLIIIVRQRCLVTAVIMVERVHDQEDVEVDGYTKTSTWEAHHHVPSEAKSLC